ELGNFYIDKSIFGDAGNDESEKKYLQKFDFGLNAGIEYQFPFGLLIGAKYTHGFTDLFQYANSYTLGDIKTDNIKIYNRSVMFSIGYVFSRKR
ncbi:MAG: PorT family protein, partial [Flavobacteriales bacterium]